ncbi:MAG: hypothetical protein AAGF11_49830 [Myxococcota bacterium]
MAQGDIQIDATFSADPPLSEPLYTIRYETIETVANDCGSAAYGLVGSTVTLTP